MQAYIHTEEDIKKFKKLYGKKSHAEIMKAFGLESKSFVYRTAKRLGIEIKAKNYIKDIDIEEFKKLYPSTDNYILAEKYGFKNISSVKKLAYDHGLKKSITYLYDTLVEANRYVKEDQIEEFCELYPVTHNKILQKKYRFKRADSVGRLARNLGLVKAPGYKNELQLKREEIAKINDEFKSLYPTAENQELAEKFGLTRKQVITKARWLKVKKVPGFKKGFMRDEFKDKDFSHNRKPVGTIVTNLVNKEWTMLIKVGPKARQWKRYNRYLWEQHHGPIPQGCVIRFKDGNKLNCVIENLELQTIGQANKSKWVNRKKPAKTICTLLKPLIARKNKLFNSFRVGRHIRKNFRLSHAENHELGLLVKEAIMLYGFVLQSKSDDELGFITDVIFELFFWKYSLTEELKKYLWEKLFPIVRRCVQYKEDETIVKDFEKFAA